MKSCRCKDCTQENPQPLVNFYKDVQNKDNLQNYCKACIKRNANKYYKENTKRVLKRVSSYQKNDKDRYNTYQRRINSSPNYRLAKNLRKRIYKFIRGEYRTSYVGCTLDKLKTYIESKFQPGMTWENYGAYMGNNKVWNLDHIKSLASFDLTDLEQLKVASHYTNIQPMWAIDNIRKGKK
jgi:hypothetical protein